MRKSVNLPIYDFFKRLDSEINFEYSKLEKTYQVYDASHAHRHDYYEILIFNESGGMHELDFVNHKIKQNSIHFISPGQVHLLRREKHVTGHVLSFKEEVFLPNVVHATEFPFFGVYSKSVLGLNKKERQKIDKTLSNLAEEYSLTHAYKAQTISAYLLLFLIELMKLYEETPASREISASKELYDRFYRLVDKNFLEKHSVAEYASLLNITPGHLNDTIKSETGKNASEIIHDRLILEAKRLLYHSTKSIKEISVFLNYEDPSYFIRFFKLHCGVTPSEFREQIRERYL